MFLLAATCFVNSFGAEKSEGQPTLNELRRKALPLAKEVKAIIGEAACTSDRECLVIGYGEKPCGGPRTYLAYSITHTNVALLENRVMEFNALAQEINRSAGMLSDCRLVPKPEASCEQNKCVAK